MTSPLRVPSPTERVLTWHVSPLVDSFAYGFSWLPILLPMALVGDNHRLDYVAAYLVVLAFTDVHRHYGFPYVYMDRQVWSWHPLRFALFPLAMFVFFVGSPYLEREGFHLSTPGVGGLAAFVVALVQLMRRDIDGLRPLRRELLGVVSASALGGLVTLAALHAGAGAGGLLLGDANWAWLGAFFAFSFALDLLAWGPARRGERRERPTFFAPLLIVAIAALTWWAQQTRGALQVTHLLNAVTVFAGAWNIWHVYMQKYGILRMYDAKRAGDAERVPGWIDRLLVWAWLPLYFFHIGSSYRDDLFRLFSRGETLLGPLVELFARVAPTATPIAALLVLVSILLFLRAEWRASRLRNRARLMMLVGTTLLASTFLLVHPLKAYLAYAFSHAVEYMVFVWAHQRRRYAEPLAHRPFIERFLRYPLTTYVLSAAALGAVFLYLKYWGALISPGAARLEFLGFSTATWVRFWTVYQSMVHFYFDGFLWKMRLPSVRATVGALDAPPSPAE